MLGWRLAISAVLIPALLAIFWLDHRSGPAAPWLFAFCLLLGIRSAWELTDLLSTRAMKPSFTVAVVGVVAILSATWSIRWLAPDGLSVSPVIAPLLAFVVAAYVCFVASGLKFREPGCTMESLGAEIFVVFYCGLLLSLAAQLRWLGNGAWGYAALGSVIVAAKSGDIGGYTLGRLFGKRKMAPRLSPGKTWAGFAGALFGAALGTWLWVKFAVPQLVPAGVASVSSLNVLAFGLVMGFVGLAGDLAESLIKRDVGRKDAAALFPGFGGLLDLLDSVLFAGPIACAWWTLAPLIS
jgi:phosphatidate cytidylyltransferase